MTEVAHSLHNTQVSEVAGLEKQISDAKILQSRRDIAIKLASNREFRTLILDGFCLHDAARYAQESADPMLDASQRADALNMAQASGHLKRFLSMTIQMGAHSERTLPELEEALAEARAEDGNS